MLKLVASFLLAFALIALGPSGALAQSTDVFGRTASGAPSAANTAEASQAVSHEKNAMRVPLPGFVRDAISASIRWQSRLNERLQDELANQRDCASMAAAWTLVLFSFAYGVLHALGPGHGKLVIGSYLASHRARFIDAVFLSTWSAFVQALSAIALVSAAAWLSRKGLPDVLTRASGLELTSYIALLAVGAWTVWSIATRRDCCDVDRIKLVPKARLARSPDSSDAYLGARLNRSRSARRWNTLSETQSGSFWIARQIFLTGIAVGVRPCVGAIFVLIAALANHIFLVGVASTFAMAAGVSCTVLAIATAGLSINRLISTQPARARKNIERIRFGLALSGAIFITLFAAWQVVALMTGWENATLA